MNDANGNRVVVLIDGKSGPYLLVPERSETAMEELLWSYGIVFEMNDTGFAKDGAEPQTEFRFGTAADAKAIQRALDGSSMWRGVPPQWRRYETTLARI